MATPTENDRREFRYCTDMAQVHSRAAVAELLRRGIGVHIRSTTQHRTNLAMSTKFNVIALFRGGTPDRAYPTSRDNTHVLVELAESGDILSWDNTGFKHNLHPIDRIGRNKNGQELVWCLNEGASGVVLSQETVSMRHDDVLPYVQRHFENRKYTCLPPDNCHAILDLLRAYVSDVPRRNATTTIRDKIR